MIKPFKDLQRESQLAISHYMGFDGEAWDVVDFDESLEDACRRYIRQHGSKLFVETHVDRLDLQKWIMERSPDIKEDFATFVEYHAWYITNGPQPDHGDSVWPVILDCTTDNREDVLEDGWHRFHSYVKKGLRVIPCVGFVRRGRDESILRLKGIDVKR